MSEKIYTTVGLWKFDGNVVTKQEVLDLANEWAALPEYTQLYVRRSGGNQWALGFVHESADEDLSKKYFETVYDSLLKKYGIAVKGYDVNTDVVFVKGY